MNNKKGDGNMFWILVIAIVAIIAGGLFIYMFKGGLAKSGENVNNLNSCATMHGKCVEEASCGSDSTKIKIGCPEIANGKAVDPKKDTCCISKNNA